MINAATLIGAPLSFQGICDIYPPSVRTVTANPQYGLYLRLLTISEEDLYDEFLKDKKNRKEDDRPLTPLELVLNCAYHSADLRKSVEEAFLLFTKKKPSFLFEEKKIVLGDLGEVLSGLDNISQLKTLNEENYFEFQNAVRRAAGLAEAKPLPPIDPNEDPRIRKMKEKIRERDRIKAKQAAEGKSKGGISLDTSLVAICCMGIGLTPLNIGELSYAAVGPIMNMMQEKEKYDIDIRSLLAGADSKKIKPKYWIRNTD